MDETPVAQTRKQKRRRWLVVLLLPLLEMIPGRYPIRRASESWVLESDAGQWVQAVASLEIQGALRFDREVTQQLSRNLRLRIPAGTTLTVDAETRPMQRDAEQITVRPDRLALRSDQALTLIYRGVVVANSRRMYSEAVDGQVRLLAAGRYRVLTALLQLPRYRRIRSGPRRIWALPDDARVEATLQFHAGREIRMKQGELRLGAEGGRLTLRDGHFADGGWQAGQVSGGISLQENFRWKDTTLMLPVPAALEIRGDILRDAESPAVLATQLAIAVPGAGLQTRSQPQPASLHDWRLSAKLRLVLPPEDLRESTLEVEIQGRMDDLGLQVGRDELWIPRLDLAAVRPRLSWPRAGREIQISTAQALDIRGIRYTHRGRRDAFRLQDGRIRLSPLRADWVDKTLHLHTPALQLEAGRIQVDRRGQPLVMLDQQVTLTAQAARLIRLREGIQVEGGQVQGRAGRFQFQWDELSLLTTAAGFRFEGELHPPDLARFSGQLSLGAQTVLRHDGEGRVPSIDLLADAQSLMVEGSQDHLRVRLPALRLQMPLARLETVIAEALALNRDRIRQQTDRRGGVRLDLQELRSVTVAENALSVEVAGRGTYRGWVTIRNDFTAEVTARLVFPEAGALDEGTMGLDLFLDRINLDRFPTWIERRIPDWLDQPLIRHRLPMAELLPDLPEGIEVETLRLEAMEDIVQLLLSGSFRFEEPPGRD